MFETGQVAQTRHDYIVTVTQSTPLLIKYDILHGTVLLRLSKRFMPDQAAVYEEALTAITTCDGATS